MVVLPLDPVLDPLELLLELHALRASVTTAPAAITDTVSRRRL
jgi:hypothetical protein